MKICLVADYIPGLHETWSGAEQLCLSLAETLQERGHTVSFITTKSRKRSASRQIYQVPIPFRQATPFTRNSPLDPSLILHSYIALKRLKPDVIHLHSKTLFFPVLIMAAILKIPVVMTVLDHFIICPRLNLRKPDGAICLDFHGARCSGCVTLSRHPNLTRILKMVPVGIKKVIAHWRFLIMEYFVRRLDAIIVLSETSRDRLQRHGLPGNRIKVIYHYRLDPKISKVEKDISPLSKPAILFVGQLSEAKGLHVVIQAMSYVVKMAPNTELMVVGPEEKHYMSKIRGMVDNLGLEGHVQFLGKKPAEEVLRLIARSKVVVVPEQWPNDYGPVILLEAKCLATPVVASRIGATLEFIEDGVDGFLVAHDQPEQFASKILWLLQHEESAQAMGERARKSAAFLFEDKSTEEIAALYNSVVLSKNREKVAARGPKPYSIKK